MSGCTVHASMYSDTLLYDAIIVLCGYQSLCNYNTPSQLHNMHAQTFSHPSRVYQRMQESDTFK